MDDKRKEVYEWRVCTDCERKFYVSLAEKEYFEERHDEKSGRPFELPKRCYKCRLERRKQNNHG